MVQLYSLFYIRLLIAIVLRYFCIHYRPPFSYGGVRIMTTRERAESREKLVGLVCFNKKNK